MKKLFSIIGLAISLAGVQGQTWTVDVRNLTPEVQKVGVGYVLGQWNQPYQRIQYSGTAASENFEVLKTVPESGPLVLWVSEASTLISNGVTRLYLVGGTNVVETFPTGYWLADVWNYMETPAYVLIGVNAPILIEPGAYRNYFGTVNESLVLSNALNTVSYSGWQLSTNALTPTKLYLADLDGEIVPNVGSAYP